jgi:tetratricopeptide (TPR) repeat protein
MFSTKPTITTFRELLGFLRANLPFIFILIFIVTACYANAINGKFISADDEPAIVYNPDLKDFGKSLNSGLLQNIFFSAFVNTTGYNTIPFHLLSLIFHILNSVLVFIVLYLIFGKKISVIASLLYAIHPVNAEAVLWVSAIPYLINGFFALLTLLFFVIFRQTNKTHFLYISAAVFFSGTILAKNAWILSIAPLIFVVGEFMLEGGKGFDFKDWKRFKIYIPFALAALFFIFTYIAAEFSLRLQRLEMLYGIDPTATTPLLNRIPYTIYMMMYLLTTPIRLSIYHEGVIITPAMYTWMVIVTGMYLGCLVYSLKRNYKVLAGILLVMPLTIFPSFSPVLIAWFIAERYLYLAAIFFCVGLAYLFLYIERKLKITRLSLFLTITLMSLYAIRTISRTNDFKSNLNIWMATQKAAPYSARTYNNLGDALAREKNFTAAIQSYETAIKISPNYADAFHNMGNTYLQKGDLTKAEELFKKANSLNPRIYQSIVMLGYIKYKQGDFQAAKEYFIKANEINPNNPQIVQVLSEIESMIRNSQPIPAAK